MKSFNINSAPCSLKRLKFDMMVKKQPYYRRGSPTETFQTEILDWMKMTSTIDAMELLARMKRLEELRAWAAYIAA